MEKRLVSLWLLLPLIAALPPHPVRSKLHESSGSLQQSETTPASNVSFWLDQTLDHFSTGPKEIWKQRYFLNQSFFKQGGPVFLCVGGEGPALSPNVVVTGEEHCALMIRLAEEHGALILALEHRFYGKSIPTADLSTESLKLLSSRQALADIAKFHGTISLQFALKPGTKWMSFGGSYPGMLAAWCRSKLPGLFHAAISSSAPVVAIPNMQGYNDVVADDLADATVGGSAECLATVKEAFASLGESLQSTAGRRELEHKFNICGSMPLENEENQAVFAQAASDPFIPQSNDPSCAGKICNIEKQCKFMLSSEFTISPLDKLAALVRVAFGKECMACDAGADKRSLTNTTKQGGTERVWLFQTCTEFAFYQTCDPDSRCPFTTSPHLTSLQSYYDMCQLAFGISGSEVETSVKASNAFYGGDKPHGASRILFVNGQVDPWHVQSVLKSNVADELPALMVPGASHHFWTHPSKPSDAPAIVAARLRIAEWVQHFLLETDGDAGLGTVA